MQEKNFYNYFFQEKNEKNTLNSLALSIFLIVFYLLKINFHECWKDEWQAWFVARDMSWAEMLGFLYYEGHPSLWYVFLKIVATLFGRFDNEIVLQTSHFMLFTAVAYWLFFKMNFSTLAKWAILLSFFVGFEYGLVNRGYVLVVLLSLIAATFIQNQETKNWKLALVLLLLCQTEVQGLIIACGFLVYLFFEKYFDKKNIKNIFQSIDFQLFAGSVFTGICLFVLTVFPRGNAEDLARAYNSNQKTLTESISIGFQGLLANNFLIGAIPDTNVFGVNIISLILSVFVLASLVYFFKNDKKTLFAWSLTFLAFFAFASFIFAGGVRQWGILFVFFIALFYLSQKGSKEINLYKMLIISIFFIFQIYYNGLAWWKEIQYPFSNAKLCATFLNEQRIPTRVPIVAINAFETGVLNGYLDRKLFALPKGEEFTYFRWLEKVYIPSEAELRLFADYKKVNGMVVVAGKPLPTQRYPSLQLWQKFDDYSIKGENFWIYTLKK